MKLPPALKHILVLVSVGVAYTLAGKFGLSLALINPSASPVWPPTGIALASLLIFGYRVYPAIFIGAFLVNVTTAGTIFTSLGIAAGNTLEALIGAYFVNFYAHGRYAFNRVADVIKFTFFAAIISTSVSATIGVTSLVLGGFEQWENYLSVWFTWWLGDAGGNFVIAPLLLVWVNNRRISLSVKKITTALIGFGLLYAVSEIVFRGILPHEYLVLPIVIAIAYVLGQRVGALAVVFLSFIAVRDTLLGLGPFAHQIALNQTLVLLQMFLGVVMLTSMSIAAARLEERRGREALENSERHFRALIENSFDGINLIDDQGTILYSSPASKSILGYAPEELVGTSGFDLVYEQDRERAQKILTGLLAEPNKVMAVEVRLKRKDGEIIWTENTATNLIHEAGVNAVVVNYRDITHRKEAEEMKTEFLSMAAHQLRTPLSSMRWNLELLLSKATTEDAKEKLSRVYEDNQRMIMWVNDLLNISRLEQGRLSDSPVATDVADLVAKIIEEEKPHAAKNSVTVSLKLKGKVPPMFIDPKRLHDVIKNLVNNAIKYNKPGGSVTIDLETQDHSLRIAVKDTGVGIPKQDMPHIFEKFYRAQNVRTSTTEGTGLGMYVVQSFVHGWGGKVDVLSVEGTGTSVSIVLPLNIGATKV